MKTNIQNRPAVFTRSMLALSFGCALASLPLSVASAQDSSSTVPRTAGTVDLNKSAAERPKLNGVEQQFLTTAAAGNAGEIKMAKLALKKSEDKGVKDFAEKMIADHGMANKDLEALAQRTNLTGFTPKPTGEDEAMYLKLEKLSGKEFDEAYIKNAVEDHSKDLEDYKQAHNQVTSKEVLNYANKYEPIIGEHYKMAKELQKSEAKS